MCNSLKRMYISVEKEVYQCKKDVHQCGKRCNRSPEQIMIFVHIKRSKVDPIGLQWKTIYC